MKRKLPVFLLGAAILIAQPRRDVYLEHGLVSDLPAQAEHQDKNLVNPWGMSSSPTSPIWVSDNGTGLVTVYDGAGKPAPAESPIVVTVPPPSGAGPSAPTGQVFNSTTGFLLDNVNKAIFLFATEDGTIAGWNPLVNAGEIAKIKVDNSSSGAVYKGLALATNSLGFSFLYATNFTQHRIDWFTTDFAPVNSPGAFLDVTIPMDFAPFNIQNINGLLYVTYARQLGKDDVPGDGNGYVNVFDPNGNLVRRLISNGPLNSPWGLALAPLDFGEFSNALLVGNFGNGHINAFDLSTGAFLGEMIGPSGQPLVIDGLWALLFGNGGQGGDLGVLYFTAGIDDEAHGLFGEIRPQHP